MELVKTTPRGTDVTTSLIIANVFEKNHKDVLRDIQNLQCSQDFRERNFAPSSYMSVQGKELPMYEITKDGFSFLVMGYTGAKAAEFKEKFIEEFNRREQLLKNPDYIIGRAMNLLTERNRILQIEVERKEEQLKLQETVIKQAAPKVEYYEDVLQSDSTYTTNQIAKEMGMSAISLNHLLSIKKIQYKQNGTWLLYHKFQGNGYTKTKTFTYTGTDGKTHTSMQTVWTEKGREFIHRIAERHKKQEEFLNN